METKISNIQKATNASCVYIPEEAVRALGITKGSKVKIDLAKNNTIVISNEKKIKNKNDIIINFLIHQGHFKDEDEVIMKALEHLLFGINNGTIKTTEQMIADTLAEMK